MNDEQILAEYAGTELEQALIWASNQDQAPAGNPPDTTDEERCELQRSFLRYGLIHEEMSIQSEWELTPRGYRIAQKLKESRERGSLRRASVQKALLRYIDDSEPSGAEDFVGQTVDRIPVTEREVERAVEALLGWGLIDGVQTAGGDLVRPSVTPLGREAADDPRPPIDFVRNGGTTIYDQRNHLQNYGHINAASAGNNVTQSGNILNHHEVSELTGTINELAALLSRIEGVPEQANDALERMETEASSGQPDQSKLQQMYMSFMTAIAVKLADESFAGVAELASQLGSLVGG